MKLMKDLTDGHGVGVGGNRYSEIKRHVYSYMKAGIRTRPLGDVYQPVSRPSMEMCQSLREIVWQSHER